MYRQHITQNFFKASQLSDTARCPQLSLDHRHTFTTWHPGLNCAACRGCICTADLFNIEGPLCCNLAPVPSAFTQLYSKCILIRHAWPSAPDCRASVRTGQRASSGTMRAGGPVGPSQQASGPVSQWARASGPARLPARAHCCQLECTRQLTFAFY